MTNCRWLVGALVGVAAAAAAADATTCLLYPSDAADDLTRCDPAAGLTNRK